MANPFDSFFNGVSKVINRVANPEPTDAEIVEVDGKLLLKVTYGDTSGGDLAFPLPKKDLKKIQQAILDYLIKS